MCYDWGETSNGAVWVLEGEAGWLSCPLFSHPSVYNYTSTQNAGHNLFWYRLPEGHDLEQPITYRYVTPSVYHHCESDGILAQFSVREYL